MGTRNCILVAFVSPLTFSTKHEQFLKSLCLSLSHSSTMNHYLSTHRTKAWNFFFSNSQLLQAAPTFFLWAGSIGCQFWAQLARLLGSGARLPARHSGNWRQEGCTGKTVEENSRERQPVTCLLHSSPILCWGSFTPWKKKEVWVDSVEYSAGGPQLLCLPPYRTVLTEYAVGGSRWERRYRAWMVLILSNPISFFFFFLIRYFLYCCFTNKIGQNITYIHP